MRSGIRPHSTASALNAYKPPSSKDIPPVALTNIQHVEPATFKPYLSQIGNLYDAFQQARAERKQELHNVQRHLGTGPSAAGTPPRTPLTRTPLPRPQQNFSARGRQASTASLQESSVRAPGSETAAGEVTSSYRHDQASLSTIPSVYSDEDFHLENPRTFDIVSERSDVVRRAFGSSANVNGSATSSGHGARKPLATNAILQEKLSWYMDTVELHLISSVSTASTTFFAALRSLKALHSEAEDSVKSIQGLRNDLKQLDKEMAIAGLDVIRKKQQMTNLEKLSDAAGQLRRVVTGAHRCRDLIDNGELQAAIDLLDEVKDLLAGKSRRGGNASDLVDLRLVKATDGLAAELDAFRDSIGKAFESQFIDALLEDLRENLKAAASRSSAQHRKLIGSSSRNSHKRLPSELSASEMSIATLRAQLSSCLTGLQRSHRTPAASAAYHDAVLREIKNLIRGRLPSSDDDDAQSVASSSVYGSRGRTQQEKSSILARNLRALEPDDAEELFAGMYSSVSETLRRLTIQVKVLLDLSSVMDGPASSVETQSLKSHGIATLQGDMDPGHATGQQSEAAGITHVLDLSSLLGQVVEVAQTQITKILKVRTDQVFLLPVPMFLRYVMLNRLFADECETVSGRGGQALKNVVNGQIKEYVVRLGDRERQALAETMDADKWDAVDFKDEDNQILQRVIGSSTMDADVWGKSGHFDGDDAREEIGGSKVNGLNVDNSIGNGQDSGTSKEKTRRAVIDEQKFILPESALAALSGITKLESLATAIPSLNSDVAYVMLDYLKLFNSRSYQLILGAGATKSAGLKNITTKHLALAHQALSFISALIPYVREFIRRQPTPPAGVLVDFDKIKRLYQEHQRGIQDKLIEIMTGRSRTHVNSMRKLDWDHPANKNSSSVSGANAYMETLTKETSTLHRVLSKHLPTMAVQMIMQPIFEKYKLQWGEAYQEIVVTTKAGRERFVVFFLEDPQYSGGICSYLSHVSLPLRVPHQLIDLRGLLRNTYIVS